MPGSRRGLLAPQNTFLDVVLKKANEQNLPFLIANAQVLDFPIVYANDIFSQQIGFPRSDLMYRSSYLKFMQGEQTNAEHLKNYRTCLDDGVGGNFEISLNMKNKTQMWCFVSLIPITNEMGETMLFLISFKDITASKIHTVEEEGNKGLAKYFRAAKNVANSRSFLGFNFSGFTQPTNRKQQKNTLTSKEHIPHYMLEPPKTPPRIILHYSALKTTWDWTILVLTFYTAILVPYKLTFLKDVTRNLQNQNQFVLFFTDTLIDAAFFVDVILNFHTTYVGAMEEVVSDPKLIRWNYLKSWFVIDMLSCVPYDVFDLIAFSTQNGTRSTGVADAFSTLKIIRLSVRVWRVARKRDHYLEYGGAQLIIFMCGFVLAAHWFACGWFLIGQYETKKKYGWLKELSVNMEADFNVSPAKVRADDISTVYISALYYTISSMTSIGFGNISANTNAEKVFSIFMMIVGALLYAAIFGNVTTIVQQLYSGSARYHEMLKNIREFMKLHQVPKELCERVMDYVVSSWASTKGINSEKVLTYCPKDMKADLCIHMNRQILKEHPSFKLASDGCLRALAVNFEMTHSAPGDLIFHTGESIDFLCFLVSGSLEVLQDDEVVALLGSGDVFGDLFWRETQCAQSTATVRALTYCDIHMIKRENLLEVLSFYSMFAVSFARNLHLTYNLRHRKRVKKIASIKKQMEEEEKQKNQPHVDIPADHPVRKLFKKFKTSNDVNEANQIKKEISDVIENHTSRSWQNSTTRVRSTWDKYFEKPISMSKNDASSSASISSDSNTAELVKELVTLKNSIKTEIDLIQQKMAKFDEILFNLNERSLTCSPPKHNTKNVETPLKNNSSVNAKIE